jgi:GTP cyclohydrolase IA
MPADLDAAQAAIAAFLKALGHPTHGAPDLEGTPARVVDAFHRDLLAGYAVDVDALLEAEVTLTERAPGGDVIVTGIAVATVCPHHLLPAVGKAAVCYRPGERVFGLGTVSRVVDAFARRLTLQEEIGERVVGALCGAGRARGASCRLELLHTCLVARGTRQAQARVITLARAGEPVDERLLASIRDER